MYKKLKTKQLSIFFVFFLFSGCVMQKETDIISKIDYETEKKVITSDEINISEESNVSFENLIDNINFQEINKSGWKTYSNEELGYEIKYPQEWIPIETIMLEPATQQIVFANKNNEDEIKQEFLSSGSAYDTVEDRVKDRVVYFSVHRNLGDRRMEDIETRKEKSFQSEKMEVNGLSFLYSINTKGDSVERIDSAEFVNDKFMYTLNYFSSVSSFDKNNFNIFSNMIRTFNITDK